MNNIPLMIIDDDDNVRFNLKLFLEDEGFECEAFENAELALAKLKSGIYKAAIVDLRLPGKNGEEFIQSAIKIDPNLKFLIHTGSTDYLVSPELEEYGVTQNYVLNKPVNDMNEFTHKLSILLHL